MCRDEDLCVDTGEEVLCARGPLGGEETLYAGRRPSVWVGGPLCG